MSIAIPRGSNAIVLREALEEHLAIQCRAQDLESDTGYRFIRLFVNGKELEYSVPSPREVEAEIFEEPQSRSTASTIDETPAKGCSHQSRSLRRLLQRKLTYNSNRLSAGQSQVFRGDDPSQFTLPDVVNHRGYKLWKLLMVLFGTMALLLSVGLSVLWERSNKSSQDDAHGLTVKLISRAQDLTQDTLKDVLVQLQSQTAQMIRVWNVPELKLACLAVELNSQSAIDATGSIVNASTEARLSQMWSELHSKFRFLNGVYFADTTGWLAGYQRLPGHAQPPSYEGVYRPGDKFTNVTGDCLTRCPPEDLLQYGLSHRFMTDRFSGEFTELSSTAPQDPRQTDWYQQALAAEGHPAWADVATLSSKKVFRISAVQAIFQDNEAVMVSRADLALDALTEFLVASEQDRRGRGGISFIVDRTDYLMACSTTVSDIRRFDSHGDPEKLLWSETNNSLIVDAARRVLAHFGGKSFSDVSSSGVHLDTDSWHVYSYQVEDMLPWIVVNSQPWEVYLGEKHREADRVIEEFLNMHRELLERKNWRLCQTIALSVGVVMLGGLVILFISKSVERPLRSMRRDMKSVAKLDFEKLEDDVRKSESLVRRGGCWYRCFGERRLVKEVSEMRDSFMFMANGLRSFAKYMDPYVVRALMDTGRVAELKVAPEEVTIFFSDMVGFTSIAESLPPTALMDLLKEYLEEMSNIILEKSGVVGEFIGDAIMAWWNAPMKLGPYHTVLALTAALEQQQRLIELRQRWAQHNKPKVEMRMGLARGEVLAGNIGSERRMKYGLVGDSVNLASRLEGLCKYYGVSILIDERAYQAGGVQEKFFCRLVDKVAVKGRCSSTEIYELVGNKDLMGAEEQQRVSKFCNDFSEIHQLYRQRDFQRALALISEYLEQWPLDKPAQIMKTRCEKDMESAADENWSPVQKMSHK